MAEIQICELVTQFSALLSNGLGLGLKASTLPKAVKLH
jgi:hypothetical protein